MTGALPGSCSLLWDDPRLPAWGTAAGATFVLALEQPGAWGAQALTDSGLDPVLGAALEASCQAAGGRALLVRAPGVAHPEAGEGARRRVLLAGGLAHGPWLLASWVTDPAELLDLPFDRLPGLSGEEATAVLGWEEAGAALLVCTNGRRDVCCALTGRALAEEVARSRPGLVWEASHLGGHRFAPTALVLPVGVALGRLTAELALEALDASAAGSLAPSSLDARHFRGRVCLDPGEQVADAAVRFATGELDPAALSVVAAPGGAEVLHDDGRAWRVATARERLGDLPVSCGKASEPTVVWRATCVTPLDDPDATAP